MSRKISPERKAAPALFETGGKFPTDHFEKKWMSAGYELVAGVDEAGRGPLAGPVVAAAVILPAGIPGHSRLRGLRDSKTLTAEQREQLFELINERAVAVKWALCTPEQIDLINILEASLQAMREAVMAISPRPALCLVDGNCAIPFSIRSVPIIKGDGKSLSIAAASIVAKVIRDRIMDRHHEEYPVYNFRINKGYGTKEHREAIIAHGPCPIHRRTFRGVKEFIADRAVDNFSLLKFNSGLNRGND